MGVSLTQSFTGGSESPDAALGGRKPEFAKDFAISQFPSDRERLIGNIFKPYECDFFMFFKAKIGQCHTPSSFLFCFHPRLVRPLARKAFWRSPPLPLPLPPLCLGRRKKKKRTAHSQIFSPLPPAGERGRRK